MIVNPNPRPTLPTRLPAPPPKQDPPETKDQNWKAIGRAALKGATLSAATMGALGDTLRVPAAAVRYAGVAGAAVVSTRTAERVYQNVMNDQNPLREGKAHLFPKAAALGAAGFAGGGIAGGLAGTLSGLAGATGGWIGIAVATAAGAAVSGGLEFLRQKL